MIVLFTCKRESLGAFGNLRLNHEPINRSETVKYRGEPKYQHHPRARWFLMTTQCTVGVSRGFKPQISHWLYLAVVRSQITCMLLFSGGQKHNRQQQQGNFQACKDLHASAPQALFQVHPQQAALEVMFWDCHLSDSSF